MSTLTYFAARNSAGWWLGVASNADGQDVDCTRKVFRSEQDAIDAITRQCQNPRPDPRDRAPLVGGSRHAS